MGNVTIKEGEEFDADERNNHLTSYESENLSSSAISEDAISLTTDSTATTTEYESANENDNCTNRGGVSSSTDIWYDYSSSVKSLVNDVSTLEDLTERSSNEVSRLINDIGESRWSRFALRGDYDDSKRGRFHDLSDLSTRHRHDNLVVKEKRSNDREFVKENDNLAKKWRRRRADVMKKNIPIKKISRKVSSRIRGTRGGFDDVAQILAKALDRVSNMLEMSVLSANDTFDVTLPVLPIELVLYDLRINEMLSKVVEYEAFYRFGYDCVFVSCDNLKPQKLRETFVRGFLSRDMYVDDLDDVVFEVQCQPNGLHFVIQISDGDVAQFEGFITSQIASVKVSDERNRNTCLKELDVLCDPQFNTEHANKKSIMNCKDNVSEAGPATAADIDSINNIPFLSDSSELDFISKVGGTGLVAETLRKQSLYVKFDPLVSAEVNSSTNDDTIKLDDTLLATAVTKENEKLDNNSFTSEEKNTSELSNDLKPESNVGKLISVTPNKSPRKITPKSSPRYTDIDPDDVSKLQSLLLKQMKREEAFKEEIESLKQENEQVLKKLHNSEQDNNNLKSVLEAVQENEKKLKNELMERIKSKQQLSLIMEEYEKTMSQMVSKRDEERKEYEATMKKLEAERDSTLQHLNNLENAFNDIHQKYERGKAVNEALKKNEDLLKKSLSEYEQTVKTVENKYELLKSHATSQLDKANQELELITQSYEKEQAKLKAMLKKSEIQINSLQNALERKSKENQELTAICDELIVKLSTHSSA